MNFYQKSFMYVDHGNIKSWKQCSYGGISLNTGGSKFLIDSFIPSLSRQI